MIKLGKKVEKNIMNTIAKNRQKLNKNLIKLGKNTENWTKALKTCWKMGENWPSKLQNH